MNGEVAQLCALCCHANAYLGGSDFPSNLNENGNFEFCATVEFTYERKRFLWGQSTKSVAKSPIDWLRWLKSEKYRRSWLTVMSRSDFFRTSDNSNDYETSAFVGGGSVWIITTQTLYGKSFSWVPNWRHQKLDPPASKRWKVEYKAINDGRDFEIPDIPAATESLSRALIDIQKFAADLEMSSWASLFERALDCLVGIESELYHDDLSPDGTLTDEERRLLHACQKSWVFGGMGSWNDLYIEHPDYPTVTEALFAAVNAGIVAAVNSSARRL